MTTFTVQTDAGFARDARLKDGCRRQPQANQSNNASKPSLLTLVLSTVAYNSTTSWLDPIKPSHRPRVDASSHRTSYSAAPLRRDCQRPTRDTQVIFYCSFFIGKKWEWISEKNKHNHELVVLLLLLPKICRWHSSIFNSFPIPLSIFITPSVCRRSSLERKSLLKILNAHNAPSNVATRRPWLSREHMRRRRRQEWWNT